MALWGRLPESSRKLLRQTAETLAGALSPADQAENESTGTGADEPTRQGGTKRHKTER